MSEHQSPNPYGGPAYGSPQAPDHPQATTILVLGIVGVFVGVVAPIAWYLGSKAKKEIEASGGRIGGLQQVTIGWILGIVMSVLLLLAVLLFVLLALVALGVFVAAG